MTLDAQVTIPLTHKGEGFENKILPQDYSNALPIYLESLSAGMVTLRVSQAKKAPNINSKPLMM